MSMLKVVRMVDKRLADMATELPWEMYNVSAEAIHHSV
jgi:hypothetical protein